MTTEPTDSQTMKRGPRKGRKLSSAASNVVQTKAKIAHDGKIDSIAKARVEHDTDSKTGKPTLTAIFPRKEGGTPHHLDLSFLLGFPNLQPMFTDALLRWGANVKPRTRSEAAADLRRYFFSYLGTSWSNMLSPEDIDDEILMGFKEFLLNRSGSRGKALKATSVGSALSNVRSVLVILTTGKWTSEANRISELVPPAPTGADKKSEPTEVLGLAHLLKILEAAEHEVLAIEHRFANGQMLLAEGHKRLQDPDRITNDTRADYKDFATCLAAFDMAYPGVSPRLDVIEKAHPKLGGAVRQTHGLGTLDSYLHPSSRDLVPFVLLLAVVTVFNPETVLNLNWRDIDFNKDHAGTPAIEIVGAKDRAPRDLPRLLDPSASASSQLSLKRLLLCLREITSRMRPHLTPAKADCLFAYVPKSRARAATVLGAHSENHSARQGSAQWHSILCMFIKDHALPSFNLAQLRPSILDLVQFMDGSLEAARKVGNHSSPATTWTYYTSDGVKNRYRERIGQIIVLRERWFQTHGSIDPRALAPSQDKGAATPGFICLDPLDSPRPNQKRGKLCRDYGGCPSCPFAAALPCDPLCVAQYTALEIAIYRSQSAMNSRTWVERWTPVLADLASLRSMIPPSVLADSRKISITLPNVG
ncbi:hypothetical protein Jab_2c22680 [Janthinobacterium sp. HH01]|uniref:hypothetical protein n=1 Tax=Janthinobacterium sp. HH01 TaxID=1198452 RepID=UPI0002AE883E|nr:hypothetical protein [Janthinobacterium sp. HH01]ELX10181.1 hypothetical protein Jab_2c22680 [Janthinobacterium sp. HH01]